MRLLSKFIFWLLGIAIIFAIFFIFFNVDFSINNPIPSKVLSECAEKGSPVFMKNIVFFSYSAAHWVATTTGIGQEGTEELVSACDTLPTFFVALGDFLYWIWQTVVSSMAKS